ncbi:MAG: aminotransferase class V-fold PLP-dependent enzyme [Rhodospirillales bacterium]|nr:aminotransferase class V-fold PLP-dependent enzyme [Rhodospirillales bacterium]
MRNDASLPIYLDFQATAPCDPAVVEAMLPYFTGRFGNPHSVEHAFGWQAEEAVEEARAALAALIGAEAREIVFTSGATEANNLAIKGAARFRRRQGRTKVVTLASEHKCVLESVRSLAEEGFEAVFLPVRPDGSADLERLAGAVDETTALVSVMAANNEIGTLQPLAEIAGIVHAQGAWLHSDAAQAAGKVTLNVRDPDLDLVSISGHKMYGPKGIGALFVRRRPRVRLEPLFSGGGQERGLRSGTLAPPLCVGLGKAAALCGQVLEEETARLWGLQRRLRGALRAGLPALRFNGHPQRRLPGNLNVTFPGVDAQALLRAVPQLALSTGSACSSASVEPSYVLRAIGLDEAAARASVRIGLGRTTTQDDVDRAAALLIAAASALQAAA